MRAVVLTLALVGCAASDGPSTDTDVDTDVATGPFLRFLAVDNALVAKVALVDTRGVDGWTTELPSGAPRDLAVVDDRVLVSTGTGAVWLALADGAVLGEITGFRDVQTARPLDGGHVLLGAQDGADAVFTEVDAEGATVGDPVRVTE